jgi:hypothetical protein
MTTLDRFVSSARHSRGRPRTSAADKTRAKREADRMFREREAEAPEAMRLYREASEAQWARMKVLRQMRLQKAAAKGEGPCSIGSSRTSRRPSPGRARMACPSRHAT